MVEKCLLGLTRIDTSCPSLLRGGFFLVVLLVVECGSDGRIIRSIGRSRLHDEAGFGLSWDYAWG